MKKLLFGILSGVAIAASAQIVIPEVANIVTVTPLTEQNRVAGRCYQLQSQPQQIQQNNSNTGMAVLGGIVGGVVGSQVGQGDGKLAATALGAGIGAVIGNGQPQSSYRQPTTTTQCESDTIQNRITGYHVVYDFRGNVSSAIVRYPPSGNTIQISITVDVPGNIANSQQNSQQRVNRF